MVIKKVSIKNFRNIEDICFTPDEKVNVLCGDNAQGKTNIIEALWLFTGAKSFRGAHDAQLLQKGKQKGEICAEFESGGVENTAKIIIGEKREAFLNGKKLKNPAELSKYFFAFVFSPQDITLASAAPAVRRRFLDTAVCQISPMYIQYLKDYTRAVTQRNNILRDCKFDAGKKIFLDDFEQAIIKNGEKILDYRRRYINKLSQIIPDIFSKLTENKEVLDISYISSINGDYETALKNSRSEDIIRGMTAIGPHRDDICFKINGFTAKEYSSQGQKRSIAIALKIAGAEILKTATGQPPTALFDDVMSELDKTRQDYILNHIKNWQVFITCCEKAHFENMRQGKIFFIRNGGVV